MLWAIDVGNTHTLFGIYRDGRWVAQWRLTTRTMGTEDELAASLHALSERSGLPFQADAMVVASVNPFVDTDLQRLAEEWLKCPVSFLRGGTDVGIEVLYQPVTAVGADRIANALGALEMVKPPVVVVDFGTATTFDAIDAGGRYLGGAILPGPDTLMEALTTKTAKLPSVPLEEPARAIGRTTAESLQSGIILGYVGALERILDKVVQELGGQAEVLVTGGLGAKMVPLCPSLNRYEPTLTLDGLRLFYERHAQSA